MRLVRVPFSEMTTKQAIRIQLVDDNEVTRTLLRGLLRGEEYDVVGEASDGEHGLEMALRLRPDVLCLDISMPKADGLEVLRQVRAQAPEIVVLMITAHTEREMVQQAIQSGASGYIVKPFNSGKVLDTIRRAVGHKAPA
jgi:two-component system, chemotaxis family, chemotaxis protein CheY